jgi:uncharacterized protein (DUF488 family)
MTSRVTTLLTVGHGTLRTADLVDLLAGARVSLVVDVRRFPGSQRSPHLARDQLAEDLPEAGIVYRWEERLGGRRSLPRGAVSVDPWWTVDAFRAYAAHTRTAEFDAAMAALLADATAHRSAVLCSETVWWRCHRRLIADVAVLAHGVEVTHLMPGGRCVAHPPAPGARLRADGKVVWDGGVPRD